MGQTGPYTACAVLARYGYGEGLEAPVMALYGPRNDKAHQAFMVGLDAAGGLPIRFKCEMSVDEILTDCSSHVNHPSTPTCSGTLVGETTHRATLNLDRGSQPLGTRRIVGKREWQRGNP